MFTKLKKSFKHIVLKLLSSVLSFLPKDKKLVLFGAMNGQWYGDNSRYVYEWTLKNRSDLKPVWITSNKGVLNNLNKMGYPVAFSKSKSGILLLHRSKVALFTNSLYDIAIDTAIVPGSLKLIALRHGRSVKRIRFARKNHKISVVEAKHRNKEGSLIDYAISTSTFISKIQEECLRIGNEKHIVTGYPRNDYLLNPTKESVDAWKTFLNGLKPKKIVLYAPSWRHGRVPTKFFPFSDFNIEKLQNFLKTNQILLLLRPHVNDLKYEEVQKLFEKLTINENYVRLATHNEFPDVNTMLPFIDFLISDYSALYHDFLLLNRPLLFIPYDYDDFDNENGFLYNYYENLPGPAINSFNAFLAHINLLLIGKDQYEEKREALLDKIHDFKDSKSCYRVVELIDKVLTTKD